eukprot:130287_1
MEKRKRLKVKHTYRGYNKNRKAKQKCKPTDTIVEPYKIGHVNTLSTKKLRKLLSKHKMPNNGVRQELIKRLLAPKQTIKQMKFEFHKKLVKARKIHTKVFKDSNYVYVDGEIRHIHQKKKLVTQ